MSLLLKRELLFWVVAAAAITGYVMLGRQFAPAIPPEPDRPAGGLINHKSIGDVIKQLNLDNKLRDKLRDTWEQAVRDRQRFLKQWYQYGAFGGVLIVLVYTWYRPPWRDVLPDGLAERKNADRKQSRRSRAKRIPAAKPSFFEAIGLSRSAFFSMLATAAIVVALLVALMAWMK